MNSKFLKTIGCLATVLALTACSSEENMGLEDNTPVAIQFTAGIGGAQTRAVDTSWDKDDAIGISCTSTGSTNFTNMKYATATGGTSGTFSYTGEGTGIFFKDYKDVTFSAYYPFKGTEGTAPGLITVNTIDQTKSKELDFLFASGVTTSSSKAINNAVPVNFNFKHKMCRLVLKIKTDATAGFAATDVATGTYYWNYFTHDGTFNTTTGIAKITGAYNENWQINATPADGADNVRTYAMILFPQSIQGQFKATINGADYISSMMDCNFAAGNSYEYTITIKKTGVAVSDCTISAWGTGATGSGSTEI